MSLSDSEETQPILSKECEDEHQLEDFEDSVSC